MKLFITGCLVLAFSPMIIALAWLARRMVQAKPYDGNDPIGFNTPCDHGSYLWCTECDNPSDPGIEVCDGCTNAMCDCHEAW